MLAILGIVSLVPEGMGNPPAVPLPQTIAAGCGTVESSFEGGRCILLSFRGEVSDGQTFERRFSEGLWFRLAPKGKQFGWDIEVVPEQNGNTGHSEYVWAVTPPYRSWNSRYLDTSYGMRATEAVRSSPRDFNFVMNEEQYKKASELVEWAIMSRPPSDKRSKEEIAKEAQDATEALFEFPVAKGRLTILESRIETSDENGNQGYLKWLKFQVDLRVPCELMVIDGSAEILVDKTQCSAERSQKKE